MESMQGTEVTSELHHYVRAPLRAGLKLLLVSSVFSQSHQRPESDRVDWDFFLDSLQFSVQTDF